MNTKQNNPDITLYVKTGCPYCAVVIHTLEELGITFEDKNIGNDSVVEELVSLGGKRQVPYMVDRSANVSMYESRDIAEYLTTHYGKPKE